MYYERLDYNECDNKNGGCDEEFESCVIVEGSPKCFDINECLVNNGGCGDALCTNNVMAKQTCGSSQSACETHPCAEGECFETEVACESDVDECPQRDCIITCDSGNPCMVGQSVCAAGDPEADGAPAPAVCQCADGYKVKDGYETAGPTGMDCVPKGVCDSDNGGCGDAEKATCTESADGTAQCTCVSGLANVDEGCNEFQCSNYCVHGTCKVSTLPSLSR